MWILDFIPDVVINIAFLISLGVVVTSILLASLIPSTFRVPTQLVGVAVLAASLWILGGKSNEEHWQAKVEEQKLEIARLEAASKEVTTQVVTKYIEKVKIVKEKTNAIQSKVPEYISKDADAKCVIPRSAVVLHDAAAKNELPDSTGGVDEGASGVTLSKLLDTTVLNYGTFYEVREQLKALQDWAREQKRINP